MFARWFAATLAVLFVALAAAPARASEASDLKKRFETRYPVLLSLKEGGKIGETYLGYVEAVKSDYLTEKVKLGEEEITVKDLLAAENKDRRRLYELLAEQYDTTSEKIAERNAKRNFEKAGAEEWLKTENGWKKKKDIGKDEEK